MRRPAVVLDRPHPLLPDRVERGLLGRLGDLGKVLFIPVVIGLEQLHPGGVERLSRALHVVDAIEGPGQSRQLALARRAGLARAFGLRRRAREQPCDHLLPPGRAHSSASASAGMPYLSPSMRSLWSSIPIASSKVGGLARIWRGPPPRSARPGPGPMREAHPERPPFHSESTRPTRAG